MAGKDDETVHAREVREIVHEVLAEQLRTAIPQDVDKTTLKSMATFLTAFGIDEEDRNEIRADFQYLRRFRKSAEQAGSYTFKAIITVIATGFAGAVLLGIKTMLARP